MAISNEFLEDIKECLLEEYPIEEVEDMLSKASIDEREDAVTVTYDTGTKDVFKKTTKLVLWYCD